MPARPASRSSVVRLWRGAAPPLETLRRLAGARHPFLRLAAGGPKDLTRWSFAGADPVETLRATIRARGPDRDPWALVSRRWPRPVQRQGPRIPFAGGWFGHLAYELRAAIEPQPPPRPAADGFPALWLGRYEAIVAWDHHRGRAYLAATAASAAEARQAIERLGERLRAPSERGTAPRAPRTPDASRRVTARLSAGAYRRQVAEVQARIRAGDLFQANLSQRFEGSLRGSPIDLFERLVTRSPVPFATYLDVGGGRRILSASPERFLSVVRRLAETRPMKGTRPRGRTPTEDRALRRDLASSEKDRAELAMIVDLSRNDLSRSCRPGTVRVACARRLERYATVHQAVAIVVGRLLDDASGVDLIRGAFPPGSVTGAPKVEAMKVIDRLEGEARGPYCGAIGWLDEGGDLDLAVAIRTLCVAGHRVSYRVGGGVTLLSDPEEERIETLDKGQALGAALTDDDPARDAFARGPRRR